MAFELKLLPYATDALEPHMSAKTLTFHHGKHHQGYVDKVNDLTSGTDLDGEDLESIILTARDESNMALFNNAAQVWNHDFFWNSLTPNPAKPSDALAAAIGDAFGGMSGFKEAFKEVATGQFGSGWAWLVSGSDGLEVSSTGNADLPLAHGSTALLCCDVWEHAYYLDYQNERGKFVDTFLEHLVNWEFAERNWQAR